MGCTFGEQEPERCQFSVRAPLCGRLPSASRDSDDNDNQYLARTFEAILANPRRK